MSQVLLLSLSSQGETEQAFVNTLQLKWSHQLCLCSFQRKQKVNNMYGTFTWHALPSSYFHGLDDLACLACYSAEDVRDFLLTLQGALPLQSCTPLVENLRGSLEQERQTMEQAGFSWRGKRWWNSMPENFLDVEYLVDATSLPFSLWETAFQEVQHFWKNQSNQASSSAVQTVNKLDAWSEQELIKPQIFKRTTDQEEGERGELNLIYTYALSPSLEQKMEVKLRTFKEQAFSVAMFEEAVEEAYQDLQEEAMDYKRRLQSLEKIFSFINRSSVCSTVHLAFSSSTLQKDFWTPQLAQDSLKVLTFPYWCAIEKFFALPLFSYQQDKLLF